jgi:DNA polymerase-3 subunit gamma/tau
MSEALYRTYRPQKFGEVIGQDVIKTILQNAVRSGRVSHAYLFTGPRGVGKTTVARILAKAVNCLKPGKDGEPDGKCDNCVAVQQGRFLDLLEIDAASYTGVENIRDIIDHVKFSPSKGKYKVFIIDEVHMLSKSAFNALLKTLEEPPAHAIFILATTEVQKVPATVVSRAQRFDFKRVSGAEIMQLFDTVLPEIKVQVPREARLIIAQAADGSFRDALSILDQLTSQGSTKLTLEEVEETLGLTRIDTNQKFLDLLLSGDSLAAIKLVKELAFAGKDLVQFTKNFLEYLRMVLFVKMEVEETAALGLTAEEEEKLKTHSVSVSGQQLLEIIKKTLEAYRETKTSPVQELPLLTEILALTLRSERKPDIQPRPTSESPAAKTLEPQKKALPDAGAVLLDLGTIVDRWAEVLARLKEYNHSLLSSLRLGRLVKLEGRELILAFPYAFHKDVLEQRKNRIVVEQVLADVFGQPLRIKISLEREVEKEKPVPKPEGDLVSEALKILGEELSS